MSTSYEEILFYAKEIIKVYPDISEEDLKQALTVKFVAKKDALSLMSCGCICNPLEDYISIISIVFNSIRKLITQDKNKLCEIQDKIDQAVSELLNPFIY